MSTPDIDRERQIAAEQEEDWAWGVWTERALAQLWAECGGKVPAPFDGITEDNQQQDERKAS